MFIGRLQPRLGGAFFKSFRKSELKIDEGLEAGGAPHRSKSGFPIRHDEYDRNLFPSDKGLEFYYYHKTKWWYYHKYYHINYLKKNGYIRREGGSKGGRWIILKNI